MIESAQLWPVGLRSRTGRRRVLCLCWPQQECSGCFETARLSILLAISIAHAAALPLVLEVRGCHALCTLFCFSGLPARKEDNLGSPEISA